MVKRNLSAKGVVLTAFPLPFWLRHFAFAILGFTIWRSAIWKFRH